MMLGLNLSLMNIRRRNAAFSPSSLAGLVGWWDFADASTLTLATAEVTAVANKGTDLYVDLVKGTTGPTLTTSGGRTYAQFAATGSANRLTGTWDAASFAAATGVSVFWSGSNTAGAGSNGLFEAHTGAVNSGFNAYFGTVSATGMTASAKGKTSALAVSQSNLPDTGWHQFDMFSDAANTVTSTDGTPDATPASGSTGDIVSVTDMVVGGLVGIFPGTNAVGELLVYNRRLSAAEAAEVRAYLKPKWSTP